VPGPCRSWHAAPGAVGKLAGLHAAKQIEILVKERRGNGLFLPGSVNVPARKRISSLRLVVDIGVAGLDQASAQS